MRWTSVKVGAVIAWFLGWFLVVVPLSYWLGVGVSGYQDDPEIVQGWGSDAIDVAIEEVVVCIVLLSICWLIGWVAIWRWADRRSNQARD